MKRDIACMTIVTTWSTEHSPGSLRKTPVHLARLHICWMSIIVRKPLKWEASDLGKWGTWERLILGQETFQSPRYWVYWVLCGRFIGKRVATPGSVHNHLKKILRVDRISQQKIWTVWRGLKSSPSSTQNWNCRGFFCRLYIGDRAALDEKGTGSVT